MSAETERERLNIKIQEIYFNHSKYPTRQHIFDAVVNFILADRKRIVAPLVKAIEESKIEYEEKSWVILSDAIDETLKLAGIDALNREG